MDTHRKQELKRQAFMRLAAQRRRAGQLRGRVVVLSLACFVVLWGIVFTQMATGNDPVLGGKEKAAVTRAAVVPRGEIETTDPRELEETRRVETESEVVEESEPEFEESEVVEESEPEVVEEPLVTSQS